MLNTYRFYSRPCLGYRPKSMALDVGSYRIKIYAVSIMSISMPLEEYISDEWISAFKFCANLPSPNGNQKVA